MRIIGFVLGAAVLLLGSWGCGDNPPSGSSALQVTSSSFTDGGTIGSQYTCHGADISPALAWTPVDGAECYAVIMDDADSMPVDFVHWNLWEISPLTQTIPEFSTDGTPGVNDFGNVGYGGPCPPPDGPHTYTISVFGLTGSACDPANQTWSRAAYRPQFATQIVDEGQISFTYSAPAI